MPTEEDEEDTAAAGGNSPPTGAALARRLLSHELTLPGFQGSRTEHARVLLPRTGATLQSIARDAFPSLVRDSSGEDGDAGARSDPPSSQNKFTRKAH